MKSEIISDTTCDDVPYIQELFTCDTASWFGHDLYLPELIEKSYICLSHKNDSELLSVICLDDFSPVTSIPRDAWLEWTREIYHCPYLSYKNSLFIHLLAWSAKCKESCLEQLLIYIYEHYHSVEHILLVIPPHVDVHSSVLKHFLPMRKADRYEDTRFSLPFYVNSRSWTLPKIEIRLADIAQADYIMEILAQKQPEAKVSYTPQLIKELLEPQDTEYRIRIVALKEDKVVGFMILDTRVDLTLLQHNFHLDMYIGPSTYTLENYEDLTRQDSNASNETISDSFVGTSYETILSSGTQLENKEESKMMGSDDAWTSKAFAISVFAVDSRHEYVIPLILNAAFWKYCPDCDLCVTSTKSDRTSPLFQYMNHISLKQNTLYPSELYAISKASALGTVSVRASTVKDIRHIAWLLEYYEDKETILQDIEAFLRSPEDNPTFRMVTICVDTYNIIGFTLISSEINFTSIESQFLIRHVMNYNAYHHDDQAVIKYLILSSPFLLHGRFIVKEILRQLDLSCLFFSRNVTKPTTLLPDIIQMMFPVKPHELMEYPSGVDENPTPYSLYFINKRLTSLLHVTNHVRAVVVGTSPTGLAFLENLIFDRTPADPCFTRVTLISKHGLWRGPHKYQELVNSIMVHDGRTEWSRVARMDTVMWVTIQIGTITEINTEEKYVIISDNEYKQNYEYLFLATRLRPSFNLASKIMMKHVCSNDTIPRVASYTNTTRQDAFQIFTQEYKHVSHGNCEADLNTPEKKVEDFDRLENVFCISNLEDAVRGLNYVEQLMKRRQCILYDRRERTSILIIGNCLGALACVHAILSLGTSLAGYDIILVELQSELLNSEEKTDTNTQFFTLDNNEVIHAVLDQLTTNQVIILRDIHIYDYGISSRRVKWVKIKSKVIELVPLQCSAVFVFSPEGLDKNMYNALSGAKVLMYQKILINAHNETNIPSIYAAGLSTRYLSRLYAEDMKYFSQVEIGQDMSRQLKKFLNSNHTYENDELPKYKRCVVERCILPGGYNYLHVHKPGKKSKHEDKNPSKYFTITTGGISKEDPCGYFQIVFDSYRTLIEITCVSRRPLRIANTIELYGKHAGLLNNIIERHCVDPIPDLYAFFEQPWAMALYHSKFNSLLDSVASLFYIPNNEDITLFSLIEKIKGSTADDTDEKRRAFVDFQFLKEDLSQEKLFHVLVNKVVEFLEKHADQLPMYATAGIMEKILSETCYHKPRQDEGDTCSNPSMPQRGYHLPRTEPVLKQELKCWLREDESISSASSVTNIVGSVGSDPGDIALGLLEPCGRDILRGIREKKMKKQ